ncbi:MAG: protein kinase [Clostridia bacterium]|nr:protein kinase [Clostridia bacterium]
MLDAKKYLGQMLAEQYLIKREIGRGASSIVFLADDMMDADVNGEPVEVAVKMTERESGEAHLSASFEKELSAVVNMPTNPHVVDIRDVSYKGREQYVVMEYVKGKTLRDMIEERGGKPFSVKEILSVSLQILQALRNAHEAGVVHRAVKPQNILVQSSEEAGNVEIPGGKDMPFIKLADFGIALLPGDDLLKGKSVGTAYYVSPEQASGGAVDHRSDLYSLGVVMYEMATGTVPFRAKSVEGVMQMHRFDEPTHARSVNGEIPLSLDQIIYDAMQKNPADRCRDAATMEKMLKDVLLEISEGASATAATTVTRRTVSVGGNEKRDVVKSAKKKAVTRSAPRIPKGVLVTVICAVLVVGLLAGGLALILNRDTVTEISVRNYVGKLYSEGSAYDEGISVTVVKESSETVPAGVIIRQSPGGGAVVSVKEGGSVELTLYVSTGPAMMDFRVPETARESESALREYLQNTYLDETGTFAVVGVMRTETAPVRDNSRPTGYVMGIYTDGGKELNMSGDEIRAKGYTNLIVRVNPEGEFALPTEYRTSESAAKSYLEATYPFFAVTVEKRMVDVKFKYREEGGETVYEVTNMSELSEYMEGKNLIGDWNLGRHQAVFALLADGTRLSLNGDTFDAYGENVPLKLVLVLYNQVPVE